MEKSSAEESPSRVPPEMSIILNDMVSAAFAIPLMSSVNPFSRFKVPPVMMMAASPSPPSTRFMDESSTVKFPAVRPSPVPTVMELPARMREPSDKVSIPARCWLAQTTWWAISTRAAVPQFSTSPPARRMMLETL